MKSVLVLGNNFTGAYGSLSCFVKEISMALKEMNHNILIANSVSEAVEAYDKNDIEFSIGIGKYLYFCKEKPLYDVYHKLHYQWIIDNPLKMEIDNASIYIKYILIDRLFLCCMGKLKNRVIYLPIGIPNTDVKKNIEKKYGIVFSGQIKDSNTIFEEINASVCKHEIMKVLEPLTSNLDLLYIPVLEKHIKKLSQSNKKTVFAYTNSFLRAYKREKVLNAIKDIPVIIIGENSSRSLLNSRNITMLGKVPYYTAFEIMGQYQFCLNIEPNFSCGFHDRILRSADQGNVVVTNYNKINSEILGNDAIYYSYSALEKITDQIFNIQPKELTEMGNRLSEKVSDYFSWDKILDFLLRDYGGAVDNGENRLFRILGNKAL
ncbi:Glycosyltransferase involved in cell wall bisynthesis [Pseudobutyrivibrio sp. ACV-2]|uniref:glycosyltransferase n=1 Tax=Pseudobutyrivibrio sp. ACV-2 TaxID=1520801 RepID=UPI00089CB94D|nr:glycosyltransferase [Pseudobutyrivibrio sp. ACV-2]SEA97057.1 Glycosyltransferase involved in cell wall bisynthesis [Pseudobutyrivibrio sp. ACV-2]